MSVEQKRADLEKALAALNEKEIEAVAGGLSKKGKEILKWVSIGAGITMGAAIGIAAGHYFGPDDKPQSKKKEMKKPENIQNDGMVK